MKPVRTPGGSARERVMCSTDPPSEYSVAHRCPDSAAGDTAHPRAAEAMLCGQFDEPLAFASEQCARGFGSPGSRRQLRHALWRASAPRSMSGHRLQRHALHLGAIRGQRQRTVVAGDSVNTTSHAASSAMHRTRRAPATRCRSARARRALAATAPAIRAAPRGRPQDRTAARWRPDSRVRAGRTAQARWWGRIHLRGRRA